MLDRLLKTIVVLTLLLFLVQAVIGLLIRIVEGTLAQVAGAFGHTSGILLAIATVAFVIGMLVRGVRFLQSRDPKVARERAARERVVRQRARRPAEGAPLVMSHAEVPADPDPAVGDEEQR